MPRRAALPRSKWLRMLNDAGARIPRGIGWSKDKDLLRQITEELVAAGHGPDFLKCARRGRPCQNTDRAAAVREVERLIEMPKRKPRVRPDRDLTREIIEVGGVGS